MTTPTIEGTRRVDPPEEREDDRSPLAQSEGLNLHLLRKARAERRALLAQLAANSNVILRLETALAGLGVEAGE